VSTWGRGWRMYMVPRVEEHPRERPAGKLGGRGRLSGATGKSGHGERLARSGESRALTWGRSRGGGWTTRGWLGRERGR
jgi:hypothetical protein